MLNQKTLDAIINFADVEIRLTKQVMRGKRLSESAMRYERNAIDRLVKTYGLTDKAERAKTVDAILERLL